MKNTISVEIIEQDGEKKARFYGIKNGKEFEVIKDLNEEGIEDLINRINSIKDNDSKEVVEPVIDTTNEDNTLENKDSNETSIRNLSVRRTAFGVLAGAILFVGGVVIGRYAKNAHEDVVVPTTEPSINDETKEEENISINKENFESEVLVFMDEANKKELGLSYDMIRSAFLVANIDNLSKEDFKALVDKENFNIVTEMQNALSFIGAVRTHNINSTMENYIDLSKISYNKIDRAILGDLDTEYRNVRSIIINKQEQEEKTISLNNVMNYVEPFFVGDGKLNLDENNTIYCMTNGGQFIAEYGYGKQIPEVIGVSGYVNDEMKVQFKTLDELLNGERVLPNIFNHDSVACLDAKVKANA